MNHNEGSECLLGAFWFIACLVLLAWLQMGRKWMPEIMIMVTEGKRLEQ